MTAPQRRRVLLFAFLATATAFGLAAFTRPSRDGFHPAGAEIAPAGSDRAQKRSHDRRTHVSGETSAAAATDARAEPALVVGQRPFDPDERARKREERAAKRAGWEEHQREATNS